MSEVLQPSLPIFEDKSVNYTISHEVMPPSRNGEGGNSRWETVRVPVNEIDLIEDEDLRVSLWREYKADEANSPFAVFPIVRSDGTLSHTMHVMRGSRLDKVGEDGLTLRERMQAKAAETEAQKKAANWLTRLFSKQR